MQIKRVDDDFYNNNNEEMWTTDYVENSRN